MHKNSAVGEVAYPSIMLASMIFNYDAFIANYYASGKWAERFS